MSPLSSIIEKEALKLWAADATIPLEQPFAKLRGLDYLSLEQKNIAILSAAPWEFSDYVAHYNPASIREYLFNSINGPLSITTTTGKTSAKTHIQCTLTNLPKQFLDCDILWVPCDNFSNIIIWNNELLSAISNKINETLVLPFMVSNQSLDTNDTDPPFSAGKTLEHSLVLNDTLIRSQLHTSHFHRIHTIKKPSFPYKETKSDGKTFISNVVPAAMAYDKSEASLQYYYAHTAPNTGHTA